MDNAISTMRIRARYICVCKNACEEISFNVKKKRIVNVLDPYTWVLHLYKEVEITEEKLVPDFPSEQYLGTFGGVLGLGGKFQVVFQLFVFILLCFGTLFARNR